MQFYQRVCKELNIQQQQQGTVFKKNSMCYPSKNYHMLGTHVYQKYRDYTHVDFFFQHLQRDPTNGAFFIEEEPTRKPHVPDFWVYLFRCGFELHHKAPSGEFFCYNWEYLDWYHFFFPF